MVGNIVVGGTGKTPLVIWLTKLLEKKGYKPGIVSRGYGGSSTKPIIIDDETSVSVSGDEPLIIYKKYSKTSLYIDKQNSRNKEITRRYRYRCRDQ